MYEFFEVPCIGKICYNFKIHFNQSKIYEKDDLNISKHDFIILKKYITNFLNYIFYYENYFIFSLTGLFDQTLYTVFFCYVLVDS